MRRHLPSPELLNDCVWRPGKCLEIEHAAESSLQATGTAESHTGRLLFHSHKCSHILYLIFCQGF